MSFNRENIIWQSKNGTWSLGFFTVAWVDDGPDADPEWDVEYDFGSFEWVSTGHVTDDSAYRAWDGANPGGYDLLPWSTAHAAEAEKYDAMAKAYRDSHRK